MDYPMLSRTIRPAAPHDSAEIARLLTALGHPAAAEDIADRWAAWAAAGNTALVAEAGGGILAGVATLHRTVVLHRPRPVGRITALVVDPAMRRQGIGRALVTAAEDTLARAGCGMLEVTSHVRLVDSHAFYEHLGYERASVRFAKILQAAV